MSKFQLVAQTVQVIPTSDGKEFNSMEEALAHQNLLDAAELISVPVQAYLNSNKMIDRNRKQKQTVVESAFAFLSSQGIDLSGIEAVEQTVFDTPPAEKVVAEETAADAGTDTTTETVADPAPAAEGEGEELF